MPSFLVRVEIRDSEDFDYEVLHELMAKIGLSRVVNLTNGNFWLPDGTYQEDLNTTCAQLSLMVRRQVSATGRDAGTVVTELSPDAEFVGLIPYKPVAELRI